MECDEPLVFIGIRLFRESCGYLYPGRDLGPGKGLALPRLPERPFRAVPGVRNPDAPSRRIAHPSGIPSAAVARNRGASVSSGFPSRQRLGGLHDATARSGTTRKAGTPVQAPPAKSALTRFPGPAGSVQPRARGVWTLPAPLWGGANRKAWPPCLVGRQAVASRQGEGAATLSGEHGRCSQRRAVRGPTAEACGLRPQRIGGPPPSEVGAGGSRSRPAAGYPLLCTMQRVRSAWRG